MWFHLQGELFWLTTIPYWIVLGSALGIRKRRGFGVFLAIAASGLLLLSDVVHWIVYQQTSIPFSTSWQEGVVYFYGLAITLYQAFPMGLLYLYSRCSDTSVKKQGHVIRGRFNPHQLLEHNGKRWLILSAVSFILPFGLLTGPLGVTHTWWRMHQMDMGQVNPRGRGMLALAQAIFAMSWLSGYFLLSVAISGFNVYSFEILNYLGGPPVLPPFWDACIFYFPSVIMALGFWQAMAAVAIYRRAYSPWSTMGQLVGILLICVGAVWQIFSSVHGDTHISPAIDLPMEGIATTIIGWSVWAVSLAGTHRVPPVPERDC